MSLPLWQWRVVFTEAQFLSLEVNIVGQYPSCLQGSFFDNGTGLSGKSEAVLNCNFGHICCHEWGYWKYVMWPPKEQLDNIQFRNKRALVQTDHHKDQTVLFHCPYRHHVRSGPHWLNVHQSAGFVADRFIGPVLILQATHVNMNPDMVIKADGALSDWLFAKQMHRERERQRQSIFFSNITLFLYPVASFLNTVHRCSHLLSAPQFERDHRGLWCPPPHTLPTPKSLSSEATRVYHTDDLRVAGMYHVIVEKHSH